MSSSNYDLVIFDHDGVLVDSEILAMELLAAIMSEHGRPMSIQEAIDTFLGTSLDFVAQTIEESGSAVDRQALDRDFHARLFAQFRERLEPIPGIAPLLEQLQQRGIPVCIASSGSAERVALGISTTGIDGYFAVEAITTREDVQRGKPHPDLFEVAAGRARVTPARCLVIEDSPHGVEAARRAGMPVVGLAYRTPPGALADADWVITDPMQVLEILDTTPAARP